jgi:hypothetical protein
MALESRGPVPLSTLLRRRIEDERNLAFASAASLVFRRPVIDGTVYALLIDAPLDRRRLMDLLFTLAPYKAHGPDRFSRVLDNWALFDRARTSDTSARLLHEHVKSLGFTWQEFERHRNVFTSVLGDSTGNRCLTPLLVWSRGEDGKRRWQFELPGEELLAAIAQARPGLPSGELDTLAGLITIPYLVPGLYKSWPAWLPLTKSGKSNYIGPASVPVMALRHRRALLNSPLIEQAEAYADNPTP